MRIFETPLAPQSGIGRVVFGVLVAVLATAALLAWTPANADDSEARRAESPYFHVSGSDGSVDRLPLKSTRVDVRIAGVIADVTVTQHYRNEGQRALEARYVFPGSTGSAVYAMNVRLGERLLTAKIREKQQARIEYETARQEGKTTTLLEQHRPNVFEMNVANILPGDEVAVELRYTELLTPHDAIYGFVFPTVVGPRYNSPQGAAAGEKWVATPYLPAGLPSPSAFEIKVILDTPVPVKEIASRSHEVRIERGDGGAATVTLAPGVAGNDRDFLLDYRLAGDRVEIGLMLFRGESENFFLALVEPPRAIAAAEISPRDYIFVVDISGSMHGYPLETSKALLERLIGSLRPSDTFNVMLFSGSNRMLAPASVPATRANIDRALQTIRQMGGGGSTEIVPALRRVAALPKAPDVSRSVIVVTDGYVTVENEVFQLVRRNLGQANVFAFGIGSSVNRHLIEGLARAGQGEAFIVTKPEEADAQAERLRKMIESPVLTHGEGARRRPRHLRHPAGAAARLLGGRPVVVYGKFRGVPQAGRAPGGRRAQRRRRLARRGQRRRPRRRRHGSAALPLGAAADRDALRPGGARGRQRAEGGDHRARPAVQPADAVHQLHRRRSRRPQPQPDAVDDGEAALGDAGRRQQPGDRRRGAEHARGRRLARPGDHAGDRRGRDCGRASPRLLKEGGHGIALCRGRPRFGADLASGAAAAAWSGRVCGDEGRGRCAACRVAPQPAPAAWPRRLRARPLAALALGGGASRRRLGRSARPGRAGRARRRHRPSRAAPSRRAGAGVARGRGVADLARHRARPGRAGPTRGRARGAGLRRGPGGVRACGHAGAAARRTGDPGLAGGLVAAVLCRLSAARGHRRGQPGAARPGRLRCLARRQRDARRRPPGDRRRAVLGRADGLDGVVLRLRRRLLARPAGPGLRPATGLRRRDRSSPATSSATPCSSASRRAAALPRRGSTRRSAWSCSASSAPRSRRWWRARASPRHGSPSSFGRKASPCRGRCWRRSRHCSPSAP
jgi:Ca-activated chloride channel family protein